MPDNEIKTLCRSHHDANFDHWLFFIAEQTTDGPDRFQFMRYLGVSSVTIPILDLGGSPIHLDRRYVCRVFAQWHGEEGGDLEAPYQLDIGYRIFWAEDNEGVAGSYGAPGELVGEAYESAAGVAIVAEPAQNVTIGHDTGGRWLDGWLRTYEFKRNPILDVESVWRR